MTSDNPFREKSVAVTGKLNNYTRDGIKARLIALGARPVSKVSKAQALGITILSEREFEVLTG